MKIDLSNFSGVISAIDATLIPETNAQTANNVDTRRGTLMGSTQGTIVDTVSSSVNSINNAYFPDDDTLYRIYGTKGQRIFVSPLVNDAWSRVYWSEKTGGLFTAKRSELAISSTKIAYNETYKRVLGIPEPTGVISAQPSSTVGQLIGEVSYIFVDELLTGELSAPSLPSTPCEMYSNENGDVIAINLTLPAYTVSTKRRIYRTDTYGSYRYLYSITNSQHTFSDTVKESLLAETLDQIDTGFLNSPPDPRTTGLTELNAGVFAAFFSNVACFSKAYLPHSWPVEYRLKVRGKIIAMSNSASGVVVLTNQKPYLIVGDTPGSMNSVEINISEPCMSAASVVDMGQYVMYAGQSGVVSVSGVDGSIISKDVINLQTWKSILADSTIVGIKYGSDYLLLTSTKAYRFSPAGGYSIIDSMKGLYGIFDPTTSSVLIQDNGNIISYPIVPTATTTAYSWTSKTFLVLRGAMFSRGKILTNNSDDSLIELIICIDDEEQDVIQVPQNAMFTLPCYDNTTGAVQRFSFTVKTNKEIIRIMFSTSVSEIK